MFDRQELIWPKSFKNLLFPTTSWKNFHRLFMVATFYTTAEEPKIPPSKKFGVNDRKLPQYGKLKFTAEVEIPSPVKNSNFIDYLNPVPFPAIQKVQKSDDFLRPPLHQGSKNLIKIIIYTFIPRSGAHILAKSNRHIE
ncbi:hypothetical protein TNCV_3774961 [Trichonephila clavipes]|nr:hypothetical protein TNCV_3774961 [Trichonephila clavipes]